MAFACAFAPGAGSESGSGWVWARMLAGFGESWVITKPELPRDEAAETRLRDLAQREGIHVLHVDIPRWARRLLGEPKLSLQHLEYVLWQIAALGVARDLHRERPFDSVWHLTWANVWIGSFACFIGAPFVFGPVGGGVGPPWRLVPALGMRGAMFEVTRAIARIAARYLNPLAWATWRRARLILVQNPETREWLPQRYRPKTFVFPNAVLDEVLQPTARPPQHRPATALFAGRLLPLKGGFFAVQTMSLLPDWRLLICGAGPDEGRLRRAASRSGVADRVRFLGWTPREEVLRLMREDADVFLFPSLHDEGSWVVAEAVACGLPVVCLDRGGPAVLAGGGVRTTSPAATVRGLSAAVRAAASRTAVAPPTDFDSSQIRLADLLRRSGLRAAPDGASGARS